MKIDGIENGIVIDHIKAGKAMLVYKYLGLDKIDASVALIQNCSSRKMGKKDIVKISALIDIDLDVIGYIDPEITINYIKDGKRIEKRHAEMPNEIIDVIHCKNPRCITSVEQELPHVFKLVNPKYRTYRCIYCDTLVKAEEID